MAKPYFCWRCGVVAPMLEAHEWREVHALLSFDRGQAVEFMEEAKVDLRTAIDALRLRACER